MKKGCHKRAKFSSSVWLFMFNKLYSFPNSHHLTLFFKNRFIQMVRRHHHQVNGHEIEQTLGDIEGQGSLECCSPWGHKE